jgi:hypothetical protein
MRAHWTKYAMAGAAAVLSLGAAGPAVWAQTGNRDDARWLDDCQHGSYRLSHGGREARVCELRVERLPRISGSLDVDGRENGGVEIAGWDGDSVVVHAAVEANASTEDAAREVASQVKIVTTGGAIHAEGPDEGHHQSWFVSYRIYVPRRTDLTLQATNGPVSVEGVTGRMNIRAENGPVALERVGGDVRARAQNGPLEVTLAGTRWDGTGLDAETENGPVDLTLPERYAAHLETGTVNGPMAIDFPVTLQGRIDLRRLSMDIGGGGAPVRVVTTNGPVNVRRE